METYMERSSSNISQCSVIQQNNVPLIEKLNEIVISFQPKLSSICGIERQCDYEKNVRGDTVFIFVSNQTEYENLKRSNANMLGLSISYPSVFITSVDPKSVGISDGNLLTTFPKSVGLFGYNSAASNTTTALVNVLKYFEDMEVKVTGFRWCVGKYGKVRNFGFLQQFDNDDASLIGTHVINGSSVQVKSNNSITLLLDMKDKELVDANRKAPLTLKTIKANKFSTTVKDIALSVIGREPLHTIRIVLNTRTFMGFKNQFMEKITKFELAVYIQCSNFAIAMIGFKNERIADIYKTMLQNTILETISEVDNAGDNENEMMQKAQLLLLKPFLRNETMYMMRKDEQILYCRYEKEWMKLSF